MLKAVIVQLNPSPQPEYIGEGEATGEGEAIATWLSQPIVQVHGKLHLGLPVCVCGEVRPLLHEGRQLTGCQLAIRHY